MAQQKLSSVVQFKAVVGSSFKTATAAVTGNLDDIRSEYGEIQAAQNKLHKFAGFDMRGLADAKKAMHEAQRETDRLGRELKATAKPTKKLQNAFARAQRNAEKATKAYRKQSGELTILSHDLKKAGINTKDLEGEFDRLADEASRTERRIQGLQKALDAGVGKKFRAVAASVGQTTVAFGASAAAMSTAVTMTNKLTGEQTALAQSLNVSADGFAAWSGLAKEIGFDSERVGDLMEELNNKIGESAGLEEITPVTESLQMLGLSFGELNALKPEEQFLRVAQAVKELDDHQKATSAADILMGGEANKFFGYLRSREEGMEELLAQQKRLNVLSDDGRAGAQRYNVAFARFSTVVSSVWQEVSGLIGGALAPVVEEWGPKLADWVRENREGFSGIGDTVRKLVPAVVSFGRGMVTVFQGVASAVTFAANAVGGFDNLAVALAAVAGGKVALSMFQFGRSIVTAGNALWPVASTALPALAAGIKAVGVAMLTTPVGWITVAVVALGAAVYRVVAVWDDLKAAFASGDGFFDTAIKMGKVFFGIDGKDEESSKPAAQFDTPPSNTHGYEPAAPRQVSVPAASGAPSAFAGTTTIDVGGIQIVSAPGMSVDELSDAVIKKINMLKRDARQRALYDE